MDRNLRKKFLCIALSLIISVPFYLLTDILLTRFYWYQILREGPGDVIDVEGLTHNSVHLAAIGQKAIDFLYHEGKKNTPSGYTAIFTLVHIGINAPGIFIPWDLGLKKSCEFALIKLLRETQNENKKKEIIGALQYLGD